MKSKPYKLTEHSCIHVLREEGVQYIVAADGVTLRDAVIHGDAQRVISALPDSCMQSIITSPPYYKQRDYNAKDQVGNEESPAEYVSRLVSIFAECRRVMKPNGLLWVNLGDKYVDGKLLGLPWRFALALSDAGWTLRSDIIWHKPNAMPSSIKNRPTTDHEYIFMFSKQADYYYNADAIREPHVTFSEQSKMRGGRNHFGKRGGTPELGKNSGNTNLHTARWDQAFHPLGRNKRTVWSIPLSKFPEAHFAVFPEKLVENCLFASTNRNDMVLDPFSGSGTTLLVARRNGRRFVGIDINKGYCQMALRRLNELQQELPLEAERRENIG